MTKSMTGAMAVVKSRCVSVDRPPSLPPLAAAGLSRTTPTTVERFRTPLEPLFAGRVAAALWPSTRTPSASPFVSPDRAPCTEDWRSLSLGRAIGLVRREEGATGRAARPGPSPLAVDDGPAGTFARAALLAVSLGRYRDHGRWARRFARSRLGLRPPGRTTGDGRSSE
jgi:hypothetical protein